MRVLRTEDFDYALPSGAIAQHPAEPRDSCRLLVLHRTSGQIDHVRFTDLGRYLEPGDLLVVNETRVLPARLQGFKTGTGGSVEVFLLRNHAGDTWECLVRPGRRVRPGAKLAFGTGDLTGLVVDVVEESGTRLVQFHVPPGRRFMDVVHEIGQTPLPPYITKPLEDPELYQTVYAREERSVAAPTAGLHFTERMLDDLCSRGIGLAKVELDVGLDTFRPVAEEDPVLHRMHSEHFRVDGDAVELVAETRDRGGRVVAVGTTSVRALESAWDEEAGGLVAREGTTDLFILPGYRFRVTDALLTNFHVPCSTLLMLVSAFAGRETVLRGYRVALEEGYRFLSFGDAMLVL